MPDLILFSTPHEAVVTLTLDSGQVITGVPCEANGRDDAHRLTVGEDVPAQGSVLRVTCAGSLPFENRGIYDPSGPRFVLDDVRLAPVPPPPPEPPPPNPQQDPFAIISAVYEQGAYDLSTKEGCGEYTGAACLALHQQHFALWGHIRKEPPQNLWDGHAVDAVMLLAKAGATDAGIYDIILDTESPDAKPAWSYKGPPDPNLWMPPT
jgi:hypothetical protein